jgi:hypothetical protein
MVFLKMNLLKNDVKDLNNLLISKMNMIFKKKKYYFIKIWILFRVAGHPLAQNERSLHVFLQETTIDHDKYVPGKVRNS